MVIFHSYVKLPEGNPVDLSISSETQDSPMSAVKRTRGKNVLAGSVPKMFGNAVGVDSQGHKEHT